MLKEVRPTIWCEVSEQNSGELTKLLHAAKTISTGRKSSPTGP